MLLVDSAPTTTTTSIGTRKANNIDVQRKAQFELFFKSVSDKQFEETDNDMKKILQAKEKILTDIDRDVFGYAVNINKKHKNSRKRRSTILDTMMRNSSKERFLEESQDLICMRRCFWERIFFIVTYGIEPPTCHC